MVMNLLKMSKFGKQTTNVSIW